ncbi:MAG: putative membrane protein [Salibacteraceae bacterium]|jgi:uncharacterized membrane protein
MEPNALLTNTLLNFAKKLETKNIVSAETGIKIRSFIRRNEDPSYWQIFLVISALFGALFASAGIFSIISHNWYDMPKHLKGFFSVIPILVALYFYYLAIFKHKDSKTWIETSSLFLMLMIGASMALVSQTYEIEGDFLKFIKVWLALTIPLFYVARASAISGFYLVLALPLLVNASPFGGFLGGETESELYWFWLYILAFIPHFYLALDKKSTKQSVRIVYMSYVFYYVLIFGLITTVKSNYILWALTAGVGFYLFGKQYMRDNMHMLMRPFSWVSQLGIVAALIAISNKWSMIMAFGSDSFMHMDRWEGEEWYYFLLLLVVMGGIYYNFFRAKEKFGEINYLIVFAPFFVIFCMIFDDFIDSWWWMSLFINFYILYIGITTMIHGSSSGNVIKVFAGLLVVAVLLGIRYFDTDLGYIAKGIVFLIVGGMFFVINLLVKDKVEEIERHKKLSE